MVRLIVLGTSSAVPDEGHENTHMVLAGKDHMLLVDCVNNPILRLRQAGLDFLRLTGLFLTHFHPDHVSGVPSLLMNSWLLGRKDPFDIYGLAYTLERVERLMGDYDWASWPNFYPVSFHPLPETELVEALENDEFSVQSSPVKHLIPTLGLRITLKESGKVLAYSCDTQPAESVVRLAQDADVLFHEATGQSVGHTSATQAGEIARRAGANSLFLIHYRPDDDLDALVAEAAATFGGPVYLAKDFMELEF